jgi:hypothetical protein
LAATQKPVNTVSRPVVVLVHFRAPSPCWNQYCPYSISCLAVAECPREPIVVVAATARAHTVAEYRWACAGTRHRTRDGTMLYDVLRNDCAQNPIHVELNVKT